MHCCKAQIARMNLGNQFHAGNCLGNAAGSSGLSESSLRAGTKVEPLRPGEERRYKAGNSHSVMPRVRGTSRVTQPG